ncbi:hypothetical protein Bpfe_014699 [Biomphalaria pfeifferi]|uniref:Uncharacterized protein n=1 Tax=Biomphalaria pfeifferi TaxID=112525 RepID=A0AAD8BLL2_BIOPF|nr:hypothetical protein Bpfe_014699 [Biomphalaria pfeifferi]
MICISLVHGRRTRIRQFVRPLLSHSDDIFWYLSELLVCFTFFDEQVGLEERREMVRNMDTIPGATPPPTQAFRDCDEKRPLSSFVTTSTRKFFQILQLPDSYLTQNVETWKENDHYQEALRIVQGLKVVNDCAERGVKLIQEYNSILTNDEQQKQYLLQLVQQHRHVLSDSKKTTVVSGLTGQPKLM